MEDEKTFNNLTFMKNQLQNNLTTKFDVCVHMFSHNVFFTYKLGSTPRCYLTLDKGEGEMLGRLVELTSNVLGQIFLAHN